MGVRLRWFLTHGCSVIHHRLCLSSYTDERRVDLLAILPPAFHPYPAPVSAVHGVIQYPAPAVGTNRRRNIGKGFIANTTQLPDTGRKPVVHVPPDQPLFIHSRHIPLAKKKLQPKKNVSSSACFCYRPACRISTAGGEKFGDNVSGTNSTCCSISPASSATWSWHIIYTLTSPGTVPNASEQESP